MSGLCDDCRRLLSERRLAVSRERRAERVSTLPPDDQRHGKYSTYCNHACRCDACTEAQRRYMADLRQRKRAGAA